ncbi:MAG: hypothetical protein ACRC20_03740 [Segniliparus sp.]|uniref:hypothetical protein n=1 Tax=Segniliparus sp. TaxID=2804064 RepID=UPI003F3791D4
MTAHIQAPEPAAAQTVAERYARSAEAWRALPSVFDQAMAEALSATDVEWTREKARELHASLAILLSAQQGVLDNFAESASALPQLSASAQIWPQTSTTADSIKTTGTLRAASSWRGDAGNSYTTAAHEQSGTADRIANSADAIAAILGKLAAAGTAYAIAAAVTTEKTTAELTDHAAALAAGHGTLRTLGHALRTAAAASELITDAADHLLRAIQSNGARLASLNETPPQA